MVTRGVIKLLRNVDCSLDSLPRTRVLVTRERRRCVIIIFGQL